MTRTNKSADTNLVCNSRTWIQLVSATLFKKAISFYKKLLLDTPQLAGGRKGASPRSGLNLVFFDA